MLRKIKRLVYFPFARYFSFFAALRLKKWDPKIVVVTGSSGKTTLLHLLEAQLGARARYSHHANSTFGIPFHILGLSRRSLTLIEWPRLILLAPFKVFTKPYAERLYIVEADCDRPGEGAFLADLLKPHITMWVSLSRTHTVNFDKLVSAKKFKSVEEAIAHEYGYFLASTQKYAIVNGDNPHILAQLARVNAKVLPITEKQNFGNYRVFNNRTVFYVSKSRYVLPGILPKNVFFELAMAKEFFKYIGFNTNESYSNFELPPGRGSVFKGYKESTLIDSSYNATPEGVFAMLETFKEYPADTKWVVLGDMIELGREEKEEHVKLAEQLYKLKFDRVFLVGPRLKRYTYPALAKNAPNLPLSLFDKPAPVLEELRHTIEGGETILFKGARFLEGIVEHLLLHPDDVAKLCRREKKWQLRRKEWGL
jgi:UDP-N-acetylmuramoyl-tripeptide--D-alanyl-D-alanine ligase